MASEVEYPGADGYNEDLGPQAEEAKMIDVPLMREEQVPPIEDGPKHESDSCYRNLHKLYTAHFFGCWGDRMWTFAVALFLVELRDMESLFAVGAYGLIRSGATFLLGAHIGNWVDRTPRWAAASRSIAAQNTLIIICCSCLIAIFAHKDTIYNDSNLIIVAETVIIIVATLADLCSVAAKITVTKDWMPVICGSDKDKLTTANAILRRIDLGTMMTAPALIGGLLSLNPLVAAAFGALWNVFSMIAELALLRSIYKRTPQLKSKDCLEAAASVTGLQTLCYPVTILFNGWSAYVKQSILLAGVSLALLHFTVLDFGETTTAYLASQCVSHLAIGIIKAGAAVAGILGTLVYPPLRRKVGLENTGLIALLGHILFLSLSLASIFVPGSPFIALPSSDLLNGVYLNATSTSNDIECSVSVTHVSMLISGVCMSRVTLWTTDLAITQMFLERVAEMQRGTVNGVQDSANQLVSLIKFAAVMALPTPDLFGILVIFTLAFIVTSVLIYGIFYCRSLTIEEPVILNLERRPQSVYVSTTAPVPGDDYYISSPSLEMDEKYR